MWQPLFVESEERLLLTLKCLFYMEHIKLVRDLEDIQRGGSEWRLRPSLKGYERKSAEDGGGAVAMEPELIGANLSLPEAPEFNDYGMRRITSINATNVIETLALAAQGLKDRGCGEAIQAIFVLAAIVRCPE